MYPSRMLNCTPYHIIIRVEKFSDLSGISGIYRISTSSRMEESLVMYTFITISTKWTNHEVYIHILLLAANGQARYPITVISLHVRRHFGILLVDSRFLGEGFSSPYSSLGMKMSLKKIGPEWIPSHSPTYLV